jgi:hypothetical protein
MFDKESRRRFIVGLMTKVAGGVVAVASLAGLSSMLSGCSDDTNAPKYGINTDSKPVVKYGPAFDMKVDTSVAPKYGIATDAKIDINSTVKYGINVDVK